MEVWKILSLGLNLLPSSNLQPRCFAYLFFQNLITVNAVRKQSGSCSNVSSMRASYDSGNIMIVVHFQFLDEVMESIFSERINIFDHRTGRGIGKVYRYRV